MSDKKLDIAHSGLTPSQAGHLLSAAKGANDALHQLEALAKALMKETEGNQYGTIHQLAKLGNVHAMDQAHATHCMIESLELGEVT